MWFWIALIAIAFLIHRYILKTMWYWRDEGVKYIPGYPLLGNFKDQIFKKKAFAEITLDLYNAMPNERYVGTALFTTPTLMIRDIELVKQITVKDFDHFVNHRGGNMEDYDNLMGKNLFFLKDERWRDMRAVLSPTFTSSKMKAMFTLMSECAKGFVEHFVKKGDNLEAMEMKDVFTRYTNDVIATCAFGHQCNSLEERENEFYMMGKKATSFHGMQKIKMMLFQIFPGVLKTFKIPLVHYTVHKFFHKIVHDSIDYREKNGLIRPDVIHLLMEARKGQSGHDSNEKIEEDTGFATVEESHIGKGKSKLKLTNDDITAQAFIFFFAGFDTSSTLMSFLAYELAVNPDVQEKLFEEIHGLMRDAKNGQLKYDDIAQMKYLDMVVSESLRKWGPGFQTDRICEKDYTIEPKLPGEQAYLVKKGTLMMVPIIGFHYDPQYFPNPEKFDPERFNDDNKKNIVPYSYLPFGIGPRNCIGSRFALLEVKILMAYLVNAFSIEVVEKTNVPLKLDTENINLAIAGGCWLGFKPRK